MTVTASFADTIHLKNGRTMKVDRAWEENGRVQYQIGSSIFNLPKSRVDRIETDHSPNSVSADDLVSVSRISGPRGKKKLYFVPIGDFPGSQMHDLVSYCEKRFRVKAEILDRLPTIGISKDPVRKQFAGEELISAIKKAYPAVAANPDSVLLGLTEDDMYARSVGWNFVFGWRVDNMAVVSTSRFWQHYADEPSDAEPKIRLRKIVSKDIGVLYYALGESTNPKSVLYNKVLSIEELDAVSEDF
ncbi:MAG TPA: hypothetical protein VKZ53_01470 [Candidatus Angelobacter sp.]|nr:hypothetical protein [Candidatus Angelobacter sp.]